MIGLVSRITTIPLQPCQGVCYVSFVSDKLGCGGDLSDFVRCIPRNKSLLSIDRQWGAISCFVECTVEDCCSPALKSNEDGIIPSLLLHLVLQCWPSDGMELGVAPTDSTFPRYKLMTCNWWTVHHMSKTKLMPATWQSQLSAPRRS